MNKADLLGEVQNSPRTGDGEITPFDPLETLDVLRFNEDYSSVPCYCTRCGITTYIPIEEANQLMELHGNGQKFPEYKLGIYIENSACPRCLLKRGESPVVKTFEVN